MCGGKDSDLASFSMCWVSALCVINETIHIGPPQFWLICRDTSLMRAGNNLADAFNSIMQGIAEVVPHTKTKNSKASSVKLYQPPAVNPTNLLARLRRRYEQCPARLGFR